MIELWIDGYRIDVEPERISQTFQNNTLGDVKDRQLNFTNTIKVYSTGLNERFFGHLLELNNQSDKPYKYLPAKIVEDGLEINVGSATITKSNDEYVELHIYSGNNSLYESINNKSILDLDWSDLNHELTHAIAQNSFDGSLPYIYALSNQTTLTNRDGYLENWLPSVYEWWIFNKIFEEAGFEYEGDLFSTDDFKEPVINPVTFDADEVNMLNRDFSKFMPDILQTEFLREIYFRYGLVFSKERNENKYKFYQLKDVFRNRDGAVDWSDKFVSIDEKTYSLGDYAQRNYFRYATKEGYNGNADGYFSIDADNLPQTKTVATSNYTVNQRVNRYDVLVFPIFEYDDESNLQIADIEPTISTIEYLPGPYSTNSDGGFGPSYPDDVPYLRFTNLNWQKFISENYYEMEKVADKAKTITAIMYLSPIDIYLLDFHKLAYIKSLSSYFYIDSINNYQSGKTVKCNLVRIPPNVFSEQEATNTAPTVELFASPMSLDQGSTVTFTHNVVDAENNVESWVLDFGDGQSQTGFGLPPSTITHIYNAPGNYNPVLTVTDFEGLTGQGTVSVTVNDTFVVTFNSNTGEYNAPPGSTVVVSGNIGGTGNPTSNFAAGNSPTATIGQPGWSTYGSRQLAYNHPTGYYSSFPSSVQFVFVMPASGVVWFKCVHEQGDGTGFNYTSVTISNNGEDKGFSVNQNNPIFP